MSTFPQELRNVTRVESAMSANLTVIDPEEMLGQALELPVSKGVAVSLIVDRQCPTRLLGPVTRTNIIEAYEREAKKMLREAWL